MTFRVMALPPKSLLCNGALLSWEWLTTCLPTGKELTPCFPLLAHLSIKLFLSVSRSFLIITHPILSPIPQGAGARGCVGFSCWLRLHPDGALGLCGCEQRFLSSPFLKTCHFINLKSAPLWNSKVLLVEGRSPQLKD